MVCCVTPSCKQDRLTPNARTFVDRRGGAPLVVLALAFFLVLGDRWSSLLRFLLGVGLSMAPMCGVGIHPLVFFVSPGGWVRFAVMAFAVAAIVRIAETVWDRRQAQEPEV